MSLRRTDHPREFLKDFSGTVVTDGYQVYHTLGRKNFVIIETAKGAKVSAVLYSLVETAKANQLNTYKYFELLLTELPKHMEDKSLRFLDDLMPWSKKVQKECPSMYKKS